MITSTRTDESSQTEHPLIEYLDSSNISSIELIARAIRMNEEDVVLTLEGFIESGLVHGTISDDKTRFFKSNVQISSAPSIRSNAEELIIESPDTSVSKYTMFGGLASIIGGLVTRALTPLSDTFQSIGASFVLIGIAILAGGWLMLSRKTSSVREV